MQEEEGFGHSATRGGGVVAGIERRGEERGGGNRQSRRDFNQGARRAVRPSALGVYSLTFLLDLTD